MVADDETRRFDMDDLNKSLAIMTMIIMLPILMVIFNTAYTMCMGVN